MALAQVFVADSVTGCQECARQVTLAGPQTGEWIIAAVLSRVGLSTDVELTWRLRPFPRCYPRVSAKPVPLISIA